jgi:hypothetical protein
MKKYMAMYESGIDLAKSWAFTLKDPPDILASFRKVNYAHGALLPSSTNKNILMPSYANPSSTTQKLHSSVAEFA